MADENTIPVAGDVVAPEAEVQTEAPVLDESDLPTEPTDENTVKPVVVEEEPVEKNTNPHREDGETQEEYNARISPAVQPVLPPVETTYLGATR